MLATATSVACSVEEGHFSRVERVLRAGDLEASGEDEPLDGLRAVPKLVDRGADIGAHRLLDQSGAIPAGIPRHQPLDGRANPVDDRAQPPALGLIRASQDL